MYCKKHYVKLLILLIASNFNLAISAPVEFTSVGDSDNTFGIEATNGLIGMSVKLVTTGAILIDYSKMIPAVTFPGPFVQFGAPWSQYSGPPMYSPVNGNISCLTALTPNQGVGQFEIVSNITVEIPEVATLTSESTNSIAKIEMIAVDVNDGVNNITDLRTLDIIYITVSASTPPTITSNGGGDTAAVSVNENQVAVTTVEAADLDGDAITYSISGGADAARFSIVGSSGVLTFVSAPDRESPVDSDGDNVYVVEVTAEDGNEGTDSQTLSVTVENVNESPVITSDGGGDTAVVSVDDGQTAVTTVVVNDVEGDAITYTVSGGADQYMFTLDNASGVLIFSVVPDYDDPIDDDEDNVYVVEVTVSDGNGGSDIQLINAAISKLSNVPSIKSNGGGDTADIIVEEGQMSVTTVLANDADGDVMTYTITGGADAGSFILDSFSGDLVFVFAPDYEDPNDSDSDNVYVVEVTATDKDGADSQTISITISDVADTIRITSDGGGDTAEVTALENQTAVTTVTAVENDGDEITYSVSGGADSGLFAIDGDSGVLTFVTEPDYENPSDGNGDNIYVVAVTAADKDGSDSQTINVTVGNADDAPIITSNGGGDTASVIVLENQTAVTTVTASVQGGGSIAYSISGGADSGLFLIDEVSGVLVFIDDPDYEDPSDSNSDNVYIVQVSASNQDGFGSQTIAVTVRNLNEAPVITSDGGGSEASIGIVENSVGVTTVAATDVDSSNLSYIISGGADASAFAINSTSGVLSFVSAPDYESPSDSNGDNVYVIEVTVSDFAGGTDIQTINVAVGNSNDAAIIVSNGGGDTARVYVEERIAAATTVKATDQDGDMISYSISGGEDSTAFLIGGSGQLYFITAPEYLTPYDSNGDNTYVVEVTVSDGHGGTDKQMISVVIGDAIEPEDAVDLQLGVHKKSAGYGTLSYSGRLEVGRVITVIAVPASGYRVKSWQGTDSREAINEQAVMLKKNKHKIVVVFEEIPQQRITKATFKAGKTRRSHEDSFDIQGLLGAGANHIPESGSSIEITLMDTNGQTLLSQTIEYDDENVVVGWPKKIVYQDRSILQGKLNYFMYDISRGKFKLYSESQDLAGWVAPMSLQIDIGDYSAYMLLYDEGANDVINKKKYMPRQFMSGETATLTVDDKKYKYAKDGRQSGKLSGRYSSTINPLEHTLTSAEILIGDFSQVLVLGKISNKDKYTYKRSKDADPAVQSIYKAIFDFDKAEFSIYYKNADFEIEHETLGITFGWDE